MTVSAYLPCHSTLELGVLNIIVSLKGSEAVVSSARFLRRCYPMHFRPRCLPRLEDIEKYI